MNTVEETQLPNRMHLAEHWPHPGHSSMVLKNKAKSKSMRYIIQGK